jgi:hypothetical protein
MFFSERGDHLYFLTMTDIAPETCDVLDRVVAAVETVTIDATDKENLDTVEDETAPTVVAAVEQNIPDCGNEVNNTSDEEEKQGLNF